MTDPVATDKGHSLELSAAQKVLKAKALASELWKRLVVVVGEAEAKELMLHVMGEKQRGRPRNEQDVALICYIYAQIRLFGRKCSAGQIAKSILAKNPFYVCLKNREVYVADEQEYALMWYGFTEDNILERRPLRITLGALEKRVERIRREELASGSLSSEHKPRPYYREPRATAPKL